MLYLYYDCIDYNLYDKRLYTIHQNMIISSRSYLYPCLSFDSNFRTKLVENLNTVVKSLRQVTVLRHRNLVIKVLNRSLFSNLKME